MADNLSSLNAISIRGFNGENAKSTSLLSDKNGQGNEYSAQEVEDDDTIQENHFADRGDLLKATLHSFALFNIAHILKNKTITSKENKIS